MPDGAPPLTLGFDTAGSYCNGLILRGDTILAARYENMVKGQAERLLPMLEEMLEEASLTWDDIERIGAGVGPGNFTGIRLSVAAARGLALSLGVPAIGVNSFEAVSYEAAEPVAAVFDARRGKAYLQVFGQGHLPDMAPCEITIDAPPPTLVGQNLACVGTAANALAEQIGGRHIPAVYAPASAIARIVARRAVRPGERPAPLYLRAPDAAPSKLVPPPILA